MLSIKQGVRMRGLGSEMAVACIIVHGVYVEERIHCEIVSVSDGNHMRGSKHYSGEAVDFKTNHIPRDRLDGIRDECARNLPGYDVLISNRGRPDECLHVEYDPE